ncbi:phosphodiesterase [Streptomyces cinereoruber]|uniref:phosphodiesterase n=1 Tax=Streptomyces cinereoruber TaxID=67260 RepID=UPI003632A2BB
MDLLDRIAFRTARAAARRRGDRPALHPRGTFLAGRLAVPGHRDPWGVPWLDAPGSHAVTARWSRGAGLPHPLPDGLGLALRVEDAGGPGRPLDLLLTTGGRGRWTRHVPLPRTSATAGPYSSLLSYVVGGRRGVVAAFPAPGSPRIPADPAAVGAAVAGRPVVFRLCFGASGADGAGVAWRPLARLTLHGEAPPTSPDGGAFDPYLNFLPGFRPVDRLRSLRLAAYAGSREGRHAAPPS